VPHNKSQSNGTSAFDLSSCLSIQHLDMLQYCRRHVCINARATALPAARDSNTPAGDNPPPGFQPTQGMNAAIINKQDITSKTKDIFRAVFIALLHYLLLQLLLRTRSHIQPERRRYSKSSRRTFSSIAISFFWSPCLKTAISCLTCSTYNGSTLTKSFRP